MLLSTILPPDELVALNEREREILTSIAISEVLGSDAIRQVLSQRVSSAAAELKAARVVDAGEAARIDTSAAEELKAVRVVDASEAARIDTSAATQLKGAARLKTTKKNQG